jgi:hypothetical protein
VNAANAFGTKAKLSPCFDWLKLLLLKRQQAFRRVAVRLHGHKNLLFRITRRVLLPKAAGQQAVKGKAGTIIIAGSGNFNER